MRLLDALLGLRRHASPSLLLTSFITQKMADHLHWSAFAAIKFISATVSVGSCKTAALMFSTQMIDGRRARYQQNIGGTLKQPCECTLHRRCIKRSCGCRKCGRLQRRRASTQLNASTA